MEGVSYDLKQTIMKSILLRRLRIDGRKKIKFNCILLITSTQLRHNQTQQWKGAWCNQSFNLSSFTCVELRIQIIVIKAVSECRIRDIKMCLLRDILFQRKTGGKDIIKQP